MIGVLEQSDSYEGLERFIGTKQFDSNFIPYRTADIEGQPMNQCIEPVYTEFGVASGDFNFPTNCGLGFVDLGYLLEDNGGYLPHDASESTGNSPIDLTHATIRCVTCKPGYYPTK